MRKKAYGFKVAGQTKQGSARLAILGKEYVTVKRQVNRDVDRARDAETKAAMRAALVGWSNDDMSKVATKGGYAGRCYAKVKSSAMPMNFYRGTGWGC